MFENALYPRIWKDSMLLPNPTLCESVIDHTVARKTLRALVFGETPQPDKMDLSCQYV